MAHDLDAIKGYMRFDDLAEGLSEDEVSAQESIIIALAAGAVEYLRNAGIPEPEEPSELYNLAVKSLVLHWYDHRDDVGSESSVPNGIRPVITQLKLVAAAKRAGGVT